ncbi:MAG TPA: amidohydrolase family protein [Methylomirabilota bacterium]|nr:amidohydrolase family protein [Methylomirabilota bacterium]
MHVHIVGNGLRGSGCWMKVGVWHRPLAAFMLRHVGVGVSTSAPDFDEAYARHLAKLVCESSLGAAVILAQDEVYDANGTRLDFGSFYVPNDYVLKLAREHDEFLPAVSIHPARANALDELERCLEAGAVMLKLLPNCHNVDCNDARYKKFWERMAAAKLPLLAHTGGEHTVPVFDKTLSDPQVLRLPLECGVTVIAAHCATKSGLTDRDYFHDFCALLVRYPNLYGDTSAFNVPVRGRHIRACLREPLASRLVHGSDYPVPVFGHWAWLQRFVDWKRFRRGERIGNILEKDFQLKRAMGFPPEHFTRIHTLLRQT